MVISMNLQFGWSNRCNAVEECQSDHWRRFERNSSDGTVGCCCPCEIPANFDWSLCWCGWASLHSVHPWNFLEFLETYCPSMATVSFAKLAQIQGIFSDAMLDLSKFRPPEYYLLAVQPKQVFAIAQHCWNFVKYFSGMGQARCILADWFRRCSHGFRWCAIYRTLAREFVRATFVCQAM